MHQNFGSYVTQSAPHKTLNLIASGPLTFDEKAVANRVGAFTASEFFFFFFFFFITLGLEMSDTKVYEPEKRAFLGTASHLCEAVVSESRTARDFTAGDLAGAHYGV